MAPLADPPFLDDDAPVRDETTLVDLVVEGTLPPALSGQFVCIGPNPIDGPRRVDGELGRPAADGMVHGVTLLAGRATGYRNRWVKTVATSRRLGIETVPGPRPAAHDAATANVFAFGGRLFALDDGALAYELDAGLETARRVDLAGGGRGVGAHPKVDPATGELHLLSEPGRPTCQHHIISAGGHTRRSRPVEAPPAAVRDLAITQDHVVFVGDGVIGLTGRGGDGQVAWSRVDLSVADRVVNAYDDGDGVVVHVTGRSLRRLSVRPAGGGVHEQVLHREPHACGWVDERLVGLPHRYVYGLAGRSPHDGMHLCKHDLGSGDRWCHRLGPDRRAGPFVFVADPARSPQEDGGWLLGLVRHRGSGGAAGPRDAPAPATSLVVLDAADLAAPPLATVHIPRRVPLGRRGCWVPRIA